MATSAKIETWETDVAYSLDESVTVPDGQGPEYTGKIYRCIFAHTSVSFATEFGNSYWEEIANVRGEKGERGRRGERGEKGEDGAAGPAGAAGTNGTDGADGIFSAIADQAEAEAGTDNVKGMSSLRVAQAIEAQFTSTAGYTTLSNAITANDSDISDLSGRVTQLEATTDKVFDRGEQALLNNQSAAVDLTADSGDALAYNAAGASSVEVDLEIYRKDDAETRFSRMKFELHYVDSTWYIVIVRNTDAVGNNPHGIELVLDQTGTEVQVQYTSDNMTGGNYDSNSYLRWQARELKSTF